jgi:hypothetical protein
VVAYLRHSIMVVLPLPLCPTMTVTGEKNSITDMCLSSKERMPRMASLFKLAIGLDERDFDTRDVKQTACTLVVLEGANIREVYHMRNNGLGDLNPIRGTDAVGEAKPCGLP